jgi:L-alanine-DL-glutamate epimerase-like enolase superfamily enzyme
VRRLACSIERFATARPFVIARGVKTHVDVVVAEVREGVHAGRGEGTAIDYLGDSAGAAQAAVLGQADAVAAGAGRADLIELMPAGAARNALDAALWDLEAKRQGRRVWQLLGLPEPRPMLTAFTISLDEPGAMAAAARAASHRELLKVKLGAGEGDLERLSAVRRAAPDARLIVDANAGWAGQDLERLLHGLAAFGVELVEQPLAPGEDDDLVHVHAPLPVCADESCQDRASLDRLAGRYAMVNVKLDKAGGLTESLALIEAARARGLGVMAGCMLGTSLAIAPAFLAAMHASHADLDAPLLLGEDRPGGLVFAGSDVHPPGLDLWG